MNNGDTHNVLSVSGRNPGHVVRSRRPASYCESREESAEKSVVRPTLAAQPMLPATLGRAGSDRAAIEVGYGLSQAACRRISSWALPIPFSQACPMAAAFSISDWLVPIARQ
jgi:hypothetical protein